MLGAKPLSFMVKYKSLFMPELLFSGLNKFLELLTIVEF